MNKSAFRKLSYGIYLISSLDGDRPTGCIANSAMQITSDPASIAISINHDNYTCLLYTSSDLMSYSLLLVPICIHADFTVSAVIPQPLSATIILL